MMPVVSKENRPAYVQFERKAIEDRDATIANGRYMTKDVDYAIITPIGSRDRIYSVVPAWLEDLRQKVRQERIPPTWLQQYEAAYAAWKKGEEIPVNGTPIKEWSLLSPAQRQNIIRANILTVEDLADANDESLRAMGMGALDLKTKAMKWLQEAKTTGKVVNENAELRTKLSALENQIAILKEQNEAIKAEAANILKQVNSRTAST